MNFYSVYVGKYDSPNVSKKDVKKLNELGMRGYLFSMGDHFSIKVATYPNQMVAENLVGILKQKGFEAYII